MALTRSGSPEKLLLVVLTGAALACTGLDNNALYRCELDGGCAQPGYRCVEGFCLPPDEPTPDAGRDAGGGGDGGALDDGGADGGGQDGGSQDAGCLPSRSCPTHPKACGSVDDGCGFALSCSDAGVSCAGIEVCGGSEPNVCGIARVCNSGGWCWENPVPQGNSLRAVWGASPTEAWAVGDTGTLLSWDGTKWTLIELGIRTSLNAIHGAARDDVYAVGDVGVILRFDGVSWAAENAGVSADLTAVHASGSGSARVGGSGGLMMVRVGGGWLSEPSSTTYGITALHALPDGTAWGYTNGYSWIRFDGSAWAPAPATPGLYFKGLWGPGDGALFAIASNGTLAYLDGGSWSSGSRIDGGGSFTGISGSSSTDVWVTGYQGSSTLAYHSDGGPWVVSVLPPSTGSLPTGIAALGQAEALVVGTTGYYANHRDGSWRTTWSFSGWPSYPVNDVFALDDNNIVAVGGSTQAIRFSRYSATRTWRTDTCSVGQSSPFTAVWVSPARKAYATGSWSNIVTFTLGTNNCSLGYDQNPWNGVWGFEDGNVHVAGGQRTGVMLGGQLPTNNLPFLPSANDAGQALTGLWGQGAGQAWMTGAGGVVLRFDGYPPDGGGWVAEGNVPSSTDLRAVHGASLEDGGLEVWLAGIEGAAYRRVNGEFTPVATGTLEDFEDVWVENDRHVWLVGGDGGAWEWNDGGFDFRPTPLREVRAVSGLADAGVWAVGVGSGIVHHR